MREIKHRGISLSSGIWIHGFFAKTENGTFIYKNIGEELVPYEVYPETVGIYISVNTVLGISIYSDDIIKHNQTKYVIKWSDNLFCYVCQDPDNRTQSGLINWRDLEWLYRVRKHIKLIGNIHEAVETKGNL